MATERLLTRKCSPTIRKLRKTLQNCSGSGLTTEILPSNQKHYRYAILTKTWSKFDDKCIFRINSTIFSSKDDHSLINICSLLIAHSWYFFSNIFGPMPNDYIQRYRTQSSNKTTNSMAKYSTKFMKRWRKSHYRVHGKIWPNLPTRGFSAITP